MHIIYVAAAGRQQVEAELDVNLSAAQKPVRRRTAAQADVPVTTARSPIN